MVEPILGTSSTRSPEDRLDSWKEIAAYLSRDVTTVQRWEKREGMPVRRHLHDRMGSVYASRAELDAWARGRNIPIATENGNGSSQATEHTSSVATPPLKRWQFALALIVMGTLLLAGITLWLQRTEYFWRSPISDAQFQTVTDFDGIEQAAAVSRDGHFIAFLSDRDGKMDVWVTQVGSGEFHNLTHGSAPELVNPSVRTLGFSPDGSLVTFWVRKPNHSTSGDISIWAVPTLGGQPRLYLEGAAEVDWSHDGSRIAYHTPGPGDPLFVSDTGGRRAEDQPIFTAPSGLHSHFPLWSPDGAFIYFVQGSLPDKMDIWRITPSDNVAERITSQNTRVTHPVWLDQRTLLYLANDPDGSGPWLYSMDVERRIPHRLTSGFDRYTSLSASANGQRIVVTLASPKKTLWRLRIPDPPGIASVAAPINLTKSISFSPRFGPDYLLYVVASGVNESIWKSANGISQELWREQGAQILGGPAISPDGKQVAFSVRKQARTLLYAMQSDGTNVRIVTDAFDLEGAPTWMPDGQAMMIAANDQGTPHLFKVSADGRSASAFLREFSVGPAWTPDGHFVVYSGPDIGTAFSVKAISPAAKMHPMPNLNLTRGSRHLAFGPGGHTLVFLRGEIQHKDLWQLDLETGAERQLTSLPADFNVQDFDVSPDGREVVLERAQERSDVALLDRTRP